jgi:hypothetical protein
MTTTASRLKALGNSVWPRRLHPCMLAEQKVRRVSGGRVIAGPFAGMKLAAASICSAFFPKMLGTYERELAGVVEELCQLRFDTIINVGAAEGYFAIGMALRCPAARVHAFECDSEGRELLLQAASDNNVASRIEVHGCCTVEALDGLLRRNPGALIIMDVEGAEDGLLRPDLIPALPGCRILVELHESVVPGIGEKIAGRFSPTHTIREIHARERVAADMPVRSVLLDRWLLKMTREFRPAGMSWYDMAVKQPGKNQEPVIVA